MEKFVFKHLLNIILANEGTMISNIKEDSGGVTNSGISLKFLKMNGIDINKDGMIDYKDIMELNKDKIEELYYEYFWKRGKCDKIYETTSKKDIFIVKQFFDIIVNLGIHAGSKLLQKAINIELAKLGMSPLIVDGVIGSVTLASLLKVDDYIGLNNSLVQLRVIKYGEIVRSIPKNAKFIVGWLARSFKFVINRK